VKLYRVTITQTKPDLQGLPVLVVRAPLPHDAKRVAVDVLCEMWPRGSKMSGVPVKLFVDELIEPENGGQGYCYPLWSVGHIYKHTFK